MWWPADRHPDENRRVPVIKTLDEFGVTASSIPQATFDYLAWQQTAM